MKITTQLTSIALLTALSCSVASAAYVSMDGQTTTTYTGSGPLIDVDYDSTNNDTRGTINAVNSDSWGAVDDVIASYLNPGLFTGGTASPTSDSVWYGVAVRQTGGALSRGSFTMRGGVKTGGVSAGFSILEIDDASNTAFDTKNLKISGILTLWAQAGGDNTLSVLNGWADVGALNGTSPNNATVNIGDGKLDAGYFHSAKLTVNMLAGGKGQFNLDDMADVGNQGANADLGNMILNFEVGSLGSMTIAGDGTGSAEGAWATLATANKLKLGNVNVTVADLADSSKWKIVNDGFGGTTLSIPEPGTYALLAGCFALASVMIRRRR